MDTTSRSTHAHVQVARHIHESTPATSTHCCRCCLGASGMVRRTHEETMARPDLRVANSSLQSAMDASSTAGSRRKLIEPAQLNRSQMPMSSVANSYNPPSLVAMATSPSRLPPISVTTKETGRRRRRQVVPDPAGEWRGNEGF